MICIASGILPSSFILADTFDGYRATPVAKGGYAHVSQASFEGRLVAVKTFFITKETDDPQRMHRVRDPVCRCWRNYSRRDLSCLLGRSWAGSGFTMKMFCPLWG